MRHFTSRLPLAATALSCSLLFIGSKQPRLGPWEAPFTRICFALNAPAFLLTRISSRFLELLGINAMGSTYLELSIFVLAVVFLWRVIGGQLDSGERGQQLSVSMSVAVAFAALATAALITIGLPRVFRSLWWYSHLTAYSEAAIESIWVAILTAYFGINVRRAWKRRVARTGGPGDP